MLEKKNPLPAREFVIPAIDIIDGKCVRLTQGDYSQKKIYNENPLEVARQFEDAGFMRLHLVDLDGARSRSVKNWKVLELISSKTKLVVDFGGGVSNRKDVDIILECGAAMVAIGSIAYSDPDEFFSWTDHYGSAKFFPGADVKEEKIAIHGWTKTTELSVFDFLDTLIQKDITHIFCTDIGKDGKLEGPSINLYTEILLKYPQLRLVASGGVESLNDLELLKESGCSGAIIGKAIYENRISLKELEKFNAAN